MESHEFIHRVSAMENQYHKEYEIKEQLMSE